MIPIEWVEEAYRKLSTQVIKTPVTYDPKLEIYFKWENLQSTGSFKLRGALNKILSLQDWELKNGLVTCSAGNHGQGVALAAQITKTTCTVFASEHAVPLKIDAMKKLNAKVILVEGGYVEAERAAIDFARETGKIFISPYNDGKVIAGQGTIMLEVLEQLGSLKDIRSVLVPVGGGGLVSGIGAVLSGCEIRPKLIGVQSEASPYAYQIIQKGNQEGVIEQESIADGLAGEIDYNSITIPLMKEYLDEVILVSEEEIREAIRFAWKNYGEMIEGSAAVGLAARLAGKIQEQPVLIVITGGNIQPQLFNSIVSTDRHQVI